MLPPLQLPLHSPRTGIAPDASDLRKCMQPSSSESDGDDDDGHPHKRSRSSSDERHRHKKHKHKHKHKHRRHKEEERDHKRHRRASKESTGSTQSPLPSPASSATSPRTQYGWSPRAAPPQVPTSPTSSTFYGAATPIAVTAARIAAAREAILNSPGRAGLQSPAAASSPRHAVHGPTMPPPHFRL